jgi:hypothetical protein
VYNFIITNPQVYSQCLARSLVKEYDLMSEEYWERIESPSGTKFYSQPTPESDFVFCIRIASFNNCITNFIGYLIKKCAMQAEYLEKCL